MAIVQQILIDRLMNYLDELILLGRVKLNGEYVSYNDSKKFKTVREGATLRKYIYLDIETGVVEEAQLLSNNGDILAVKPFSITKQDNGLVLAFEFKLVVQEG